MAVIDGANNAQIARIIEMVIVESSFIMIFFLSSFDREIISKKIFRDKCGGNSMKLTYEELVCLNEMISVALMSGKVEFDEVSESVHKKVTNEIVRRNEKQFITSE